MEVPQTAVRYRRSPGAVIYWAGSQAVCFAWQASQRIPISIHVAGVLQELSEWTSAAELRDRISPEGDLSTIEETLDLLYQTRLVERERDRFNSAWDEWSPEAAFFHFATKNGVFPADLHARDRELVEKAKQQPPPEPTKRLGGPRVNLVRRELADVDMASALSQRRTWRNFADQPVSLDALGTLLDRTFGVQRHAHVPEQGRVILRTSPSGGSRHPIEAYVIALNVEGLAPGVYHYDSLAKDLVDLQRPIASSDIAPLLAHQAYFARAAAIVVMCPVFARTRWRYGHSRAYRTVLIDAGHLGQTFCLVATALGLAPFTTMAFSESAIEQLLSLDGIDECPIYVAGVGMPDPTAVDNPGRWGD